MRRLRVLKNRLRSPFRHQAVEDELERELRLHIDALTKEHMDNGLLGLKPAAGRHLTKDDDRLDPPVAVIGYGYWQRRFGGAEDALGQTLKYRDRASRSSE